MRSPYYIDEPCVISFSGGRTSAYMLIEILEAHGGNLPQEHTVIFSNTGKEMPETLDFVHRCEHELSIDIVWLELASMKSISLGNEKNRFEKTYQVVDYNTASRNGEPFEVLLNALPSIPNAAGRYCTAEMKIRPMTQYATDIGYEKPFLTAVGIRADEERRAVKIHGSISNGQEKYCPLYVDGVTAKDVGDFWAQMPWDLELPNNNGVTDWGNCDLCFLKGRSKRASIMAAKPELADWWIDAEKKKGQQFRPDEPSYEQMKHIALTQQDFFGYLDDETIPCFCGD